MTKPEKACDLVMKGGITSGVVYPKAVQVLSKEYRFSQIGGTSAGAIAAVVTAAAEYGREKGGFEKVAELSKDLSENLLVKFQPDKGLKPLFEFATATMPFSVFRAALALFKSYKNEALKGALFGALAALALCLADMTFGNPGPSTVIIAIVLTLSGAFYRAGRALYKQVMEDLPANDYGICSGKTQEGNTKPALTDWLTDVINETAGLRKDEGPLTIGHLIEKKITVKTVTTDIVTRRPYALPIRENTYAFLPSEFLQLFPKEVVECMTSHSAPVEQEKWGRNDLYYFKSEQLPVVVIARMSLSFPGLISAVPLYWIDHTLQGTDNADKVVRCLFSDGGLSSNFPVHFFDAVLPRTPTFGISLGEYDSKRVSEDRAKDPDKGRINLPVDAKAGRLIRTFLFEGIGPFIMAMFNSAKDWQDTLQTVLPGYRERIVTIDLNSDEGGLNLKMESEKIALLTNMGEQAGQRIVETFCFKEHRWRRYLVQQQAMETLLIDYFQRFTAAPPDDDTLDYPSMITDYEPNSFKYFSPQERKAMRGRSEKLAALGKCFLDDELREGTWKKIPASRSHLRNIADMD